MPIFNTVYYPRFPKPPAYFDWFISDPHFGHHKIIEYGKRPFFNTIEMDAHLIRTWNEHVQPNQSILCLGDFTLTKDKVYCHNIMRRLNGNKFLIAGNHDHWLKHEELHEYWTIFPDIIRFEMKLPNGDNKNVVFSHFPQVTWEKAARNSWKIHGHSHGNLDYLNADTTRIDLGIDATVKWTKEYRPVSWREVCQQLTKKSYKVVDHHGASNHYKDEM